MIAVLPGERPWLIDEVVCEMLGLDPDEERAKALAIIHARSWSKPAGGRSSPARKSNQFWMGSAGARRQRNLANDSVLIARRSEKSGFDHGA